MHPNFDPDTFDFDLALIELKTNITDIPRSQLASLVTKGQELRLALPGTKAIVTGWGDTGDRFPLELREVSVPIVDRDQCNADVSYDGAVTRRMICAGLREGGKDSCQGDSGGPLVVKSNAGVFEKQAGITSWGNGCALPNFYGVYTRVAAFEPWITGKMEAMRGSAASAMACEISGGRATSPACHRAAKDEAEREMTAYADAIKRRAAPDKARTVAAAQQDFMRSIGGICAFEATLNGQLGREDCIAREARKRADALAVELSDLAN